jgi:hypothetical protein
VLAILTILKLDSISYVKSTVIKKVDLIFKILNSCKYRDVAH